MIENIFGHDVYITQVTLNGAFEKYRTAFTNQIVNATNNLPLLPERQGRGNSRSTIANPDLLSNMIGYSAFVSSLNPYLAEARKLLLPNQAGNFSLVRGWSNVMQYGSSVVSHVHSRIKDNHILCVFYLEAPPGSARFGIVNDDREGMGVYEYSSDQLYFVPTVTNQLVCHLNNVNHLVEQHSLKERRISIILELAL